MAVDQKFDAVVIGSGPNGLAAGITLAKAGMAVAILESAAHPGGGMRTEELTLPGFWNDHCASVFPFYNSPFFRDIEGIRYVWVRSPLSLAHPFDDGSCAFLDPSIDVTAESLGRDKKNYKKIFGFMQRHWFQLESNILSPLWGWPSHSLVLFKFGYYAGRSGYNFLDNFFLEERSRALLAGVMHHITTPLTNMFSAAPGIVLTALNHIGGWPICSGGAESIVHLLIKLFENNGGKLLMNYRVNSLSDLPAAKYYLWDTDPTQFVKIAGTKTPKNYRDSLEKYKYGCAVFKIDYALSAPVPFIAKECLRSATVHLGGSFEEIRQAETAAHKGVIPERPFVIASQASLFDPHRAPEGKHTFWAYAHVPRYSTVDITDKIEDQIERFAPGFRDLILKRFITDPVEMESYDANFVGGDISTGIMDLPKITSGPVWHWPPYSMPIKGHYWCSSAAPPGAGVHGMCGFNAAKAILKYYRNDADQISKATKSP
jgi:phytoene dehydrogenase-like protein